MAIRPITAADGSIYFVDDTTSTSAADSSFRDLYSSAITSSSLSDIYDKASIAYGVPKDLLIAVTKAESEFNPGITSKSGAMGLMQLMPETASYFGVTNAYDPEQNVMAGAQYLSQLLSKYDNNISYALAAYNAGSGNVDKYGGVPPFEETKNYVDKILGYLINGVELPDGLSWNGEISSSLVSGADSAGGAVVSFFDSISKIFDYDDYIDFIRLFLEKVTTNMQRSFTGEEADAVSEVREAAEEARSATNTDSYVAYQNLSHGNINIFLKPEDA